MKKILFYLLVLVSVFGVASCSKGGSSASTSDGSKPLTIGVTTITLQHQFFIDIDNGIKDVAKEHNVQVLVNDPNQDTIKQTSAVEDFLQKGVDGIIVMSIDGTTIIPTVEEAAKTTPVLTVDAVVATDAVTSHVGTVNEDAGYELGLHLKDYINENLGGKAKIGIVTFLESVIQQDRIKGFKAAFEGMDVQFLNPLPGYDRETALSTVESMLQANSDVDIIFATAENAVLGAKAALESANNTRVKITGFDLTSESADGIKSGVIVSMLQQQPYMMGKIAAETMLKIINGETVDASIPTPIIVYDINNINDYE